MIKTNLITVFYILWKIYRISFKGSYYKESFYCCSYGDIAPKSFSGRVVAVVWIIIGLVLSSIFVSTLTTAIIVASVNEDVKLYGTKVCRRFYVDDAFGFVSVTEEYFLKVLLKKDDCTLLL